MLAKVLSAGTSGIEAFLVDCEVDISAGLPASTVVGLPDAAVRESRDRVKAAITNSRYFYPARRITVNLAPADTKKEGPAFDLPIALGIIAATDQAKMPRLDRYIVIGRAGARRQRAAGRRARCPSRSRRAPPRWRASSSRGKTPPRPRSSTA